MSVMRALLYVSFGLALTLSVSQPSWAADVKNGEQLARRWCASCHLVNEARSGVSSEAPPFTGIATRPGFDAGKLALFLLDPHPKMPDLGLSRAAAADIAAYIASLK